MTIVNAIRNNISSLTGGLTKEFVKLLDGKERKIVEGIFSSKPISFSASDGKVILSKCTRIFNCNIPESSSSFWSFLNRLFQAISHWWHGALKTDDLVNRILQGKSTAVQKVEKPIPITTVPDMTTIIRAQLDPTYRESLSNQLFLKLNSLYAKRNQIQKEIKDESILIVAPKIYMERQNGREEELKKTQREIQKIKEQLISLGLQG